MYIVCALLTDDVAGGLEGELHDALVLVGGGQVEHGKDVLPAGADVAGLGVHHLGNAAHHHVSDGGRSEGEKERGRISVFGTDVMKL